MQAMFRAALVALLVVSSGPALASVVAKIDLSKQVMSVYKNGRLAYTWPVSTARKGYRTPIGTYRPTRMHEMWYSRKYDMSPMPHSIFFLGGYAIHGTDAVRSLGRPASHGCIRLHPANARKLYSMVRADRSDTRIVIQR